MKLTQEEKDLLGRILKDIQPFNPMSFKTEYTSESQLLRHQADELERKAKDRFDFARLVAKLLE